MNELFNKDIDLNDTGYGYWDICVEDKEFVTLNGLKSLENGIIIAILTRFNELKQLPSYDNFGCKVHDLIKARKTRLNEFKIKTYIKESVEAMNRIKKVDDVTLTPTRLGYKAKIYCTSINGNKVSVEVNL